MITAKIILATMTTMAIQGKLRDDDCIINLYFIF